VPEIVDNGEVVIRTKQSFGDPDSTLASRQFKPRTAASLKDTGLLDVIKAAIDEFVQQGG
jgi:ABC-type tungstate transport system permease subunit